MSGKVLTHQTYDNSCTKQQGQAFYDYLSDPPTLLSFHGFRNKTQYGGFRAKATKNGKKTSQIESQKITSHFFN